MTDNLSDHDRWGKPAGDEENAQGSQEQIDSQETIRDANPGIPEKTELPLFSTKDLSEPLREGVRRQGWTELMPVQARAIPYIMANRDLIIQSRTGSGKTGAYLIPILERIKPELNYTQALVLVPTRELAFQVVREAGVLSSAMNIRVAAVYGGVSYGPQLEAFREGAHLVIGTPGRILDHLLRRSFNLNKLRILVFDEADRMLSMGFYPDMKRVQRYLPDYPINTYMFSATYPPRVLALANEFMRAPDFLNLSSDHVHVTETEHVLYNVPAMDKERSLVRIIEIENPASALIFANTRERVHFVNVILQRYGYRSEEISSDLSQSAREEVMEHIRQGQIRFLVATDVAARGIDLPELSHVIIYEPPENQEDYIHRAGRTGRAGASGVAISLVNSLEQVELLRIAKRYKIDLEERPLPKDEDVQAVVTQRVEALLESRLRSRDRLLTERLQRFLPMLKNLEDDDEVLTGLAMLVDDFYHQEFHTAQLPPIEEKPFEGSRAPVRSAHNQELKRGGRRGSSRSGETGGQSGGVQSSSEENQPGREARNQGQAGESKPGRGRRRSRSGGRKPRDTNTGTGSTGSGSESQTGS